MLAPQSPKRRPAKALLAALAALLVVFLLIFRLRGASFDWKLFLGALSGVEWIWMLGSMLLILLSYVVRALRWEIMLRPLGAKPSIRKLTFDTAIGFTAVVLLGRVGEVVRPYLISVSAGVSLSSQMAAWFLERILDLLAVLLLFGFALTRIPAHNLALSQGLRWVLEVGGYVAAAIGAICLLFLIVFRNFHEPAQHRILSAMAVLPENYYKRSEQLLAAFSHGLEATREGSSLALITFYTILEWVIIVLCYYTLFRGLKATAFFTITDVVILLGFISFGSIVQIPGIGGGMQVASIVVLNQIYGMSLETASGVALFIWLITFVVVIPFGLLCAFYEGWNWSTLKQLARQPSSEDEPL